MVIWVVGMSGAGKTTLAKELVRQRRAQVPNVVLVDGDDVRRMVGADGSPGDYDMIARRKNAERLVALCQWLDRQGIDVVCSILCIFPDILVANRQRFSSYFQVELLADMSVLVQRDIKNIYAPALAGDRKHVVGVDIAYPSDTHSDWKIDNSVPQNMAALAREIWSRAQAQTSLEVHYPYGYGDRLEDRNTYFYTPYIGTDIFPAWARNRRWACRDICPMRHVFGEAGLPLPADGEWEAELVLRGLLGRLDAGEDPESSDIAWLQKWVQKWEVSKRVFARYDERFKPVDQSGYTRLSLYLLLATLMANAYDRFSELPYLNAFIKLLDTLCAQHNGLNDQEVAHLAWLADREKYFVTGLAKRIGREALCT